MYAIKITWADGSITRATVTKAALRGLKLTACASVSFVKVRSE